MKRFIASWKEEHAPIYTFTAEDGVRHVAWKIADEEVITSLVNLFEDIPNLYIADGHHRSASAAKSRTYAKRTISELHRRRRV